MTINSLMSTVSASMTAAVSGSSSLSRSNSTAGVTQDSASGVSELATLMKKLQALQTSDPAKFKEVTGDIAKKLQEAAKTEAAAGDSAGAQALNDLASKFTTASETGKMPHLHHGGRGGHMGPPPTAPPDPDSEAAGTSETAAKYQDLLAMFQQNSSNDPMAALTGILSSEFSTQSS